MKKTKKKINILTIILIFFTAFFSIIIFLSIPVLYNYKSLQNEIEKQFYSEFKIELEILGEISRQNFPRPHLTIEKANLKLESNNSETQNLLVKKLKISIPYRNFFSKSKFKMMSTEITGSNIKFKYSDIKKFREHLYYKINKPVIIKNSKFFYLDKNNETILISPIENLEYFINKKSNSKELKIIGNIFNIDFNSIWIRKYDNPHESIHKIKFIDPDLIYNNLFQSDKKNNFTGITSIKFLDEKINIKYTKNNNKIFLNIPSEAKNQSIKIISEIDLNPFYFDTNLILDNKNLNFILDYLIYSLLKLTPESLGNINGNLLLSLQNIDNDLFNNGTVNILINDKKIKNKETLLELGNIGLIKSEFEFKEENGEILFNSRNILEVKSVRNFARKFQINVKKLKNLKQIYFVLQKNINSNTVYISNININKKQDNLDTQIYEIQNPNELKSIVKLIFDN